MSCPSTKRKGHQSGPVDNVGVNEDPLELPRRCSEQADIRCAAQVPESKDQVIKPERVLVLSKSMRVRWRQLEAGLQGVKSLDDIMRIDLHYLSRCLPINVLCCAMEFRTP